MEIPLDLGRRSVESYLTSSNASLACHHHGEPSLFRPFPSSAVQCCICSREHMYPCLHHCTCTVAYVAARVLLHTSLRVYCCVCCCTRIAVYIVVHVPLRTGLCVYCCVHRCTRIVAYVAAGMFCVACRGTDAMLCQQVSGCQSVNAENVCTCTNPPWVVALCTSWKRGSESGNVVLFPPLRNVKGRCAFSSVAVDRTPTMKLFACPGLSTGIVQMLHE